MTVRAPTRHRPGRPLLRGIAAGAAAGAAGTTALNAVTYLDMAARGRPASSTPEDTVERLSERTHLRVPGDAQSRRNRLAGLGPLMGLLAGLGAGAAVGAARAVGWPRGFKGSFAMATIVALAVGNGPMTLLRITDPGRWSASDWASDVVPHVAYGAVAAATMVGLDGPAVR